MSRSGGGGNLESMIAEKEPVRWQGSGAEGSRDTDDSLHTLIMHGLRVDWMEQVDRKHTFRKENKVMREISWNYLF